jgi:DNA-directed RNA polymerase subunit RPC12/RpoP
MALIQCPECGKEISDQAENCIHCGFPLHDKVQSDKTELYNVIIVTPKNGYVIAKQNISKVEAETYKKDQERFGSQIEILNASVDIDQFYRDTILTIRCPRCRSTAITTGARGVNWTWGLIGASKTVNRCGSCGYTWKP